MGDIEALAAALSFLSVIFAGDATAALACTVFPLEEIHTRFAKTALMPGIPPRTSADLVLVPRMLGTTQEVQQTLETDAIGSLQTSMLLSEDDEKAPEDTPRG